MSNQASIESLQAYIMELTAYINENNAKYTKNMNTLKHYYEEQISDSNGNMESANNQINSLKNELLMARDVINNKSLQLKEKQYALQQQKQEKNELREKLGMERKKIDDLYSKMEEMHRLHQKEILSYQQQCNQHHLPLSIKIKQLESQNKVLQNEIKTLQQQVSARYSMPDKIHDLQLTHQKDVSDLEAAMKKNHQLSKKEEFLQLEVAKLRKDNEKLRIHKEKSQLENKLAVQMAIIKQKEKWERKLGSLDTQLKNQITRSQDLQQKLKQMKKNATKSTEEHTKHKESYQNLKHQLVKIAQQKDSYLQEFRKLKEEYDGVINRLQAACIQSQKKIFHLQQQNKELNDQLDGLQQLLRELRAMNQLQPARAQYRKFAQLEILAKREEQKAKMHDIFDQKSSPMKKDSVNNDNHDLHWEKLLMEIDNIPV